LLAVVGSPNWKIEPPFARGDTQIRPSWFVAIQHLEREGVIARRRSRIVICNRAKLGKLGKLSNGTYIPADDKQG
jgi:hypothetical protein